jgi:hypothetical protein
VPSVPTPPKRSVKPVPNADWGLLPLDLALAILGVMVVGLVMKLLRFDDPRWLYNAWTYALGAPTGLIVISMLLRSFVSEQVERSIQIGFLASVIAHLLLMLLAVNVVLFSGMWPDATQEIARRLRDSSRGNQFTQWSQTEDRSRPEYLQPVPSELTRPNQADIRPSESVDSPLNAIREPLEANVPNSPEIERAASEIDAPQISTESKPIERPVRDPKSPGENRPIEIPAEPTRTSDVTPMASIRERAEQLDVARSGAATPAPVLAMPSGVWLPETEINKSMRRSSTQPLDAPSIAARSEREAPSADRLAQPEAFAPSVNRSVPKLERQGRSIEIPPVGGIAASGQSSGVLDSTASNAPGAAADTAMLDRTGNTRAASDLPSKTGANPLSEPAVGGIAIEPSIAGNTRSLASPIPAAPPLGVLPSTDIGVSPLGISRFRRSGSSGESKSRTQVAVPAPAFKQRMRRNEEAMNQDLQAMGPLGPKTEEAIEAGLEFLAKHQREDGSWRLEDFGAQPLLRSDTAATALALLSFQGAGYSHEQFKYQQTCRGAIDWLLANQKTDGDLYRPMDEASDRNAWLYSHAIAALALCEAYGMTQDESIRKGAQRSIDFLVISQDPFAGGWRYSPRAGSDTSVTGWAMMALKSAELAGLSVPARVYGGIKKWLNASEASAQEPYLYRYNWQANTPEAMHGRNPTPVMTSVGLLMRLYLGWQRSTVDMQRGADWLLERLPSLGTVDAPKRDTYYWYYASQVMFHMGGERWRRWYGSLYPILIDTQEHDGPYAGSWNPVGEIPDTWGPFAGRLYVTTLNLLSLEVTYRHLPIFEATARLEP